MLNDLATHFDNNERITFETNVTSLGLSFMYSQMDDDKSKQCYELIFEQGKIDDEIKRLCKKDYNGRIMTLIRNYIFKLVDRKHDVRKGWSMLVMFLNYASSETPVIRQIYARHIGIGKDYYSEKLKTIIKEVTKYEKEKSRASQPV